MGARLDGNDGTGAGFHRIAGPTFERRMIDASMRPSGFDYMRLGLAITVIFFHSREFSSASPALPFLTRWPFNVLDLSAVPMFFILGGFLVGGSLDRCRTIFDFTGLRALRIFPALMVDTLLAATILGPALTTLPPAAYFGSPGFRSYFLNVVGDIHYTLPGVFVGNPYPFANVQLWSIPYELSCCLVLALMALVGLYRRRRAFLTAALLVLLFFQTCTPLLGITNYRHAMVVPSFLIGVAAHLYRDRIPWHPRIFLLSIVALAATITVPHMIRLLPLPLTYATVFLGTLNPKRVWPIRTGDYSYGTYLYGFPVSQAWVATLPAARIWYVDFALTMLATGGLAMLSWHGVEKKCLALKPRLFGLTAAVMKRLPREVARMVSLDTRAGEAARATDAANGLSPAPNSG